MLPRYDPHVLATWRTFLMFRGTVFFDPAIWWTVAKLIAVAVASGGLLCIQPPAARARKARQIEGEILSKQMCTCQQGCAFEGYLSSA